MIYVGVRVLVTVGIAVIALLLIGKTSANGLSDALLAAVAGFVGFRFLLGYRKEDEAEKTSDAGKKATLKADALTYYSFAAFQSPPLLYAGLFACALKFAAVMAQIEALCGAVPGCR